MADFKIVGKLVIDDSGTLKVIAGDSKKAAAGLEQTAKSAGTADRNLKGAAKASANGTKNFSKMAQGMTGTLVPAYATLAAHIFAVTAAFGALKRAAALEQLEQGLEYVGNAAGKNLGYVANQLREITGLAISSQSAMEATALGTSAGFSSDQLQNLTKVARGASLALGRDMEDAMSRLIRGAAKLEPEILDELGIMVRLDDATENYARTLGKSVGDLSQFERRMAFTNMIIDQGIDKFGGIAEAIDVNPFDRLAAAFADITKQGLNFINVFITPVVEFLGNNTVGLIGAVTMFGSSVTKQMLPAFYDSAKAAKEDAAALVEDSKAKLQNLKEAKKLPKAYGELEDKLRAGTASSEDYKKAIGSLDKSLAMHNRQLESNINYQDKTTDKYKEKISVMNDVKLVRAQLTEAIYLENMAKAKEHEADAISAASNLKLRDMMKSYQLAIKSSIAAHAELAVSQGIAKSTLTKLRLGFSLATISIKTFGTALLAAIPIIGQVIMVASLLWEGFKKFTEKSEIAKKVDEVTESFTSFGSITKQLESTLQNTTDKADAFVAELRATAGAVDQITTAVLTLQKAQEDSLKPQLLAQYKRLSAIDPDLNKAKDALVNQFGEDLATKIVSAGEGGARYSELENISGVTINQSKALREYNLLNQKRIGLQNTILAIEEKAMTLAKEEALAVLKSGEIAAKTSGLWVHMTEEQKKGLSEVREEVKNGTIKTWPEFRKRLQSVGEAGKKALAALDNKEVFSSLQDNLKGVGTSADSTYKKLKDSYKAILNEYNNLNTELLRSDYLKEHAKDLSGLVDFGGGSLETGINKTIALLDKIESVQKQYGVKINVSKFLPGIGDPDSLQNIINLYDQIAVKKEELLNTETELKITAADPRLTQAQQENLRINQANLAVDKTRYNITLAYADYLNKVGTEEEAKALQKLRDLNAELELNIQIANFTEKSAALERQKRADAELYAQKQLEITLEKDKQSIAETKMAGLTPLMAERAQEKLNIEKKITEQKALQAQLANIEARLGTAAEDEKPELLRDLEESKSSLELVNTELAVMKEQSKDSTKVMDTLYSSMESGFTSAFTSIFDGTKTVSEAFDDMAKSVLNALSQMLAKMIAVAIMQKIIGMVNPAVSTGQTSLVTSSNPLGLTAGQELRTGGIISEGRKLPGYATGGVASGSTSGYPVMMHGTEAVVPLPDNRSIPVDLRGSAQGETNVIINNYGDAQNVTTEEQQNANGGTDIIVTIEKDMSNRLASRGSKLSRTLEATYGLKRVGGR